jgi:hypothetical protein
MMKLMGRAGDPEFDEIVRQIREDPEARVAIRDELAKLTLPRRGDPACRRVGYVIRVELVSGGGASHLDPPPGRDILVSPNHTFRQLAETINASFARWDLGHLYVFRMADGTEIGTPFEDESIRDPGRSKIARRDDGEVFEFEFDFGDSWLHRCTVVEHDVTPEDVYGIKPKGPVAVWGWGWGWGSIPDQYGRTTPDG